MDFPKFGDVITPDGLAIVCAVERIRHVCKHIQVRPRAVAFPLLLGGAPKKNAFEMLKLKLRVFGPCAAIPRDSRRPVVDGAVPVIILTCSDVVPIRPAIDIVPVKKIPKGSRAFTVLFTLCVGKPVPWEPT